MVDCGCATPDEAFQGLEDDNDLESAADRRARTAKESSPDRRDVDAS